MIFLYVKSAIVLILFICQVCLTQRRIQNGQPLTEDKPYMAYFIRASSSKQQYDAWLCGGTIVTSRSIITSAACLEDVKFMYAIAGYKEYVKLDKLNQNECTKQAKKKVILTCVPKRYEFEYEKIESWSLIDIGIAKVESKFDFTKTVGKCSYAPAKIKVNFNDKYQIPGVDAFVLGWGHANKWRECDLHGAVGGICQLFPSAIVLGDIPLRSDIMWATPTPQARPMADTADYNQQLLHYTTTVIINKDECKKAYSNIPTLSETIDKYMICADGPGSISPIGDVIQEQPRIAEGCDPTRRYNSESCENKHVRPIHSQKSSASGRSGRNRATYNQPNPEVYGHPNPAGYGRPYERPDHQTYVQQNGQTIHGNGQPYGKSISGTYGQPYRPRLRSRYKSRRGSDSVNLNSTYGDFTQNTTLFGTFTDRFTNASRRNGICQNDHGGPLVSWVGSREYLIGVASVFRINEKRDCIGPYLYTSTQCNAAFLDCMLSDDEDWERPQVAELTNTDSDHGMNDTSRKHYLNGYTRKEFCSLPPPLKEFDMVRRQISWAHHPDGPADNELTQHDLENLRMRPQIPMNDYASR